MNAGTVLTASRLVVDAERMHAPGAIAVSGGAVAASGDPVDVLRAVPAAWARLDFPGATILPGLVNAHTHLQIPPVGLPAPGAGDSPFVEWILRVIAWRRGAPPGEFARNFAAATGQALAFGTTAAGEIAGADLSVYERSPLRARVYAEGIGFLPEAAEAAAARVAAAVDRIAEACARGEGAGPAGSPFLAPGISPHTPYTVGEALLARLAEMALSRRLPLCLHLAESPAEMEFLRTGGGPVADRLYGSVGVDVSGFRGIGTSLTGYLARAGVLREGTLLVHNVHLSREEILDARARGARFVLCPRSNVAHGNGAPDVTRFVDAAIPFALGTDSLGSVPTLSLWDEMRAALALYRGNRPGEEVARTLFCAATVHGAAAVAMEGGTLRPGAPADFVLADDAGGTGGGFLARLVDRTEAGNIRGTAVAGMFRHGGPCDGKGRTD